MAANKARGNATRASITMSNAELGRGSVKKAPSKVAPEPTKPPKTEIKDALPLTNLVNTDHFIEWVKGVATRKRTEEEGKPVAPRVSPLALLSFSTPKERVMMFVGLLAAGVAGLGLPTWLVLLANSLDTFASLARISEAGGNVSDLLQRQLVKLVIAFAVLGVVILFAGFLYVAIWTYTGEKQALRIKNQFVKAAVRQDAEWFDLNNREEVPTLIANAMVHISEAIGRHYADLFANLVSAAGSLGVALMLNAPLAIVMLLVVPVVSMVMMIIGCFLRRESTAASGHFVAAGGLATEVISGIKTVASLCAEQWALTTYLNHVQSGQKRSIYSGFLTGLMAGITGLLFYFTYTVAFLIGTQQVAKDMELSIVIGCFVSTQPNCRVTGASVMCCIYGVILCATFVGLMAPGLNAINQGRQAAAVVFQTIDRIPAIDPSSPSGAELNKVEGGLEFRDVFFVYPSRPKNPIFLKLNLTIPAGSSTAFVGPSGSGKSTITKLLLRFYDTTSGNVLVDGEPIDSLNVSWWRQQIGYVAQTPVLFPGTLRYNIACGKPGASEEEIIAAAKAACADEFIRNLPQGYDTFYSGTSVQLSGGQMQRICIARAVIRNPAVLLLDEATSALDTNSERQVQDALANIRKVKKITTISVAHRLSTIVNCDQIAVISDGAIAELGTHRALLEHRGIYASLCETQGITLDSTFAAVHTSQPEEQAKGEGGKAAPDIENGLMKSEGEETETDEVKSLPSIRSRLWTMSKSEWGFIAMGTVGAFCVGALPPVEGILTARIVANFYTVSADDLVETNRRETLYFLILGAFSLIGNVLSGCGFSVSGYRLSCRMRSLAFESIVRRNMGWFDRPEHSVGELTTRLEADAEGVAKVTGWALGYRVRVCASLTAGVVIALAFSWQIGLTAIACVPLIMGASLVQKYCLKPRPPAFADGLSPETIFEQALRGIESVQSYALQDKVCSSYAAALEPEAADNVRRGFTAGLVYGLSQFSVFGSFAIIFYVGSLLLVEVEIDFIGFFTAILAVMFGALGIASVNADVNAQQAGLDAAARVFELIDEPLTDSDPFSADGDEPEKLEGAIEFKGVSFAYPTRQNHPIYYPSSEHRDGFELAIDPKDSVGFCGKSGCGKSTALQILMRFYDATSGTVLLDGHDIQDLNVNWLRRQIGYVGQMPTLFAGTVRSNILLGNPKATDHEIIAAAKAANAHNFIIKLTGEYDADIGNGGSLLSGGQRQRIAIARAIVSNPKMLVLDEATSALDNESEKIVQETLDKLQEAQPRTTLMVAHRLTTVKGCDKIVVLGGGGVRELGSHDELLEKNDGLYRELWLQQGGSA